MLQLVRSSFYLYSNQRLIMSAQKANSQLFIRSGHGAAHSYRGVQATQSARVFRRVPRPSTESNLHNASHARTQRRNDFIGLPVIPVFPAGPGHNNPRSDLISFLQLVRSAFYWCSNQRLMISAQTVGFYLFIRSGRGASLSQHDCLNLTIVSFHSISSNSWKMGFGRSTLEGRFCESWKFFLCLTLLGLLRKKWILLQIACFLSYLR